MPCRARSDFPVIWVVHQPRPNEPIPCMSTFLQKVHIEDLRISRFRAKDHEFPWRGRCRTFPGFKRICELLRDLLPGSLWHPPGRVRSTTSCRVRSTTSGGLRSTTADATESGGTDCSIRVFDIIGTRTRRVLLCGVPTSTMSGSRKGIPGRARPQRIDLGTKGFLLGFHLVAHLVP